ncbi:MAPEG family protein [Aestuariirhabdus sp. Z084]|uniref:MAPEG family protein n=1 Tax=Aestuariirhabdus haliotis TaxID=2918751 RepID=UPI00201B3670|nr:MAPEG family protein [Aestuariirhabdus haliotis]MCL6415718.1 MAPEG family protein [Aestuariirhabdus haliotis]MCL6419756.1 MAPEG family protein [Aestuariirhabdus haliotis]
MSSSTILYPAFAMFCLTLGVIFYMGFLRFIAIRNHQVKISFFRTYDEGTQPRRLHLLARHVQNHFETPPLFYIGIILSYLTHNDSFSVLLFSWLFVVARIVHTFIHLGSNNVSYRFFTFGFSLVCLCGIWVSIFRTLL